MKARHARALAVGASAALAYLGGARVRDTMPVRGTTLLALATVAVAGIVSAKNTAVTLETRARLNDFLGGTQTPEGSHIHGHLNVHGDHTVTGGMTVNGEAAHYGLANFHGETEHNGHKMNGVDHVYSNGGGIGFYDQVYMNGKDFWMQGGDLHAKTGTY